MILRINLFSLVMVWSGSMLHAADLAYFIIKAANKSSRSFSIMITTTKEDEASYETIIPVGMIGVLKIPASQKYPAGELHIQINEAHTLLKGIYNGVAQLGVIKNTQEDLYKATIANLFIVQGYDFIQISSINSAMNLEKEIELSDVPMFNAIKKERGKPESPTVTKKSNGTPVYKQAD